MLDKEISALPKQIHRQQASGKIHAKTCFDHEQKCPLAVQLSLSSDPIFFHFFTSSRWQTKEADVMKCSGDGRGSRSFTEPCLQHLQKKATEGRFIEQKIQTGEIDRDLEII